MLLLPFVGHPVFSFLPSSLLWIDDSLAHVVFMENIPTMKNIIHEIASAFTNHGVFIVCFFFPPDVFSFLLECSNSENFSKPTHQFVDHVFDSCESDACSVLLDCLLKKLFRQLVLFNSFPTLKFSIGSPFFELSAKKLPGAVVFLIFLLTFLLFAPRLHSPLKSFLLNG